MTDEIKHECGFVLLRLLKPLEYYQKKYGSWMYGIQKLYLLMEKQHNRGQDGAGAVCVKLDIPPGNPFIYRHRSNSNSAISDIFNEIYASIPSNSLDNKDANYAKNNFPFAGELYLGHLRYGTFGKNNIENVHPVMRENNWITRNLILAGNFNLTNVDEQFEHLIDLGQHPKGYSDTVTMLEKIGHFLDREVELKFKKFKEIGLSNVEITDSIARSIDLKNILFEASKKWDGGYVIAGLLGHGDAFVIRDPWGIRPAYFYYDNEIAVVASERPAIQTAFNLSVNQVIELPHGSGLIIKKDGTIHQEVIREPYQKKSCSFERIYFSRGTDKDIYNERKKLGELIATDILQAVNFDLENTVFSYIPNTAEIAFFGIRKRIVDYLHEYKKQQILALGNTLTPQKLEEILSLSYRAEKIAVKDAKIRTFITEDKERNDLVSHVYDVTYGVIRKKKDNLVIIDDSIVRGTTFKQTVLRILDRLEAKKIIVVSSAPQIRYPDCYGIDMAKLGDFVAFQAAIELLKQTKQEFIIEQVYSKCLNQQHKSKEQIINYVKEIYAPFTYTQISEKVAELLKPSDMKTPVEVIFQTIENLHAACPNHSGDWYFTGDYPTPGGNKVANTSFINYIEGRNQRAYS